MNITVYFFGGPGGMLDKAARHIFESHGGRNIGAGTFLPTGERDVEYDVPNDRVLACREALEKAGLRLSSSGSAP